MKGQPPFNLVPWGAIVEFQALVATTGALISGLGTSTRNAKDNRRARLFPF